MAKHSERCADCKQNISRLLSKIYGDVREKHSLGLSAGLDAYRGHACFESLRVIYEKLQEYRGYRHFVRSARLRQPDYYVPQPGIIIEFDESQHFTQPRLVSLRYYPPELTLGYDINRWIELSRRLNQHDNDPVYRDEQRAWYDTLRDFAPMVLGILPTIRLYAGDEEWCALDPERKEDVNLFRSHLSGSGEVGA